MNQRILCILSLVSLLSFSKAGVIKKERVCYDNDGKEIPCKLMVTKSEDNGVKDKRQWGLFGDDDFGGDDWGFGSSSRSGGDGGHILGDEEFGGDLGNGGHIFAGDDFDDDWGFGSSGRSGSSGSSGSSTRSGGDEGHIIGDDEFGGSSLGNGGHIFGDDDDFGGSFGGSSLSGGNDGHIIGDEEFANNPKGNDGPFGGDDWFGDDDWFGGSGFGGSSNTGNSLGDDDDWLGGLGDLNSGNSGAGDIGGGHIDIGGGDDWGTGFTDGDWGFGDGSWGGNGGSSLGGGDDDEGITRGGGSSSSSSTYNGSAKLSINSLTMTSFHDCSSQETSVLKNVIDDITTYRAAAEYVAGHLSEDSMFEQIYVKYFMDKSNLSHVQQITSSVNSMGTIEAYCDHSAEICDSTTIAYTYQGSREFHVCNNFFNHMMFGSINDHQSEGASVVYHEMTHCFGTDDHAYGEQDSLSLSASKACDNADTYRLFAMKCIYYLNERGSKSYKNSNIKLSKNERIDFRKTTEYKDKVLPPKGSTNKFNSNITVENKKINGKNVRVYRRN